VIASGGGGGSDDVVQVLTKGCADAALMAGALHDGSCTVTELKTAMQRSGIRIREVACATAI
jgi:imidazole glycerol-phosphate synthase subunit HisF